MLVLGLVLVLDLRLGVGLGLGLGLVSVLGSGLESRLLTVWTVMDGYLIVIW